MGQDFNPTLARKSTVTKMHTNFPTMANATANLLSHEVGTTRMHYLTQDRKRASVTVAEQIARGIGTIQRCTATVNDILPLAPDKDVTIQRRCV